MDRLFPPGTPTAVVQSYLERSGLECWRPEGTGRWVGAVVCFGGHLVPSDQTRGVLWRIDILSAVSPDRLSQFNVLWHSDITDKLWL